MITATDKPDIFTVTWPTIQFRTLSGNTIECRDTEANRNLAPSFAGLTRRFATMNGTLSECQKQDIGQDDSDE